MSLFPRFGTLIDLDFMHAAAVTMARAMMRKMIVIAFALRYTTKVSLFLQSLCDIRADSKCYVVEPFLCPEHQFLQTRV